MASRRQNQRLSYFKLLYNQNMIGVEDYVCHYLILIGISLIILTPYICNERYEKRSIRKYKSLGESRWTGGEHQVFTE